MKKLHKVELLEDDSFNNVIGGVASPSNNLGGLLSSIGQTLAASPLPVLSQVGTQVGVLIAKLPANIKNIPLPSLTMPH